jgi:hypothetical protein
MATYVQYQRTPGAHANDTQSVLVIDATRSFDVDAALAAGAGTVTVNARDRVLVARLDGYWPLRRIGTTTTGPAALFSEPVSAKIADPSPEQVLVLDANGDWVNGNLKPPTATVQYVAAAGNDGADGKSWGTAKATVAAALAAVTDRGEIIMGAGDITETTTCLIERTAILDNKHVTIRGAGENRTRWTRATDIPILRVKGVDGTTTLANDVTIMDLTMDGRGERDGGPAFTSPILDTKNTNHLNFNHVRFYNVNGTGIAAYAPENWKFTDCRFSAMGLGTAAGFAVVNGGAGEFEANGIKWVNCDWEINYLGRDVSIIGTAGKLASNFAWSSCKFESMSGPPYAANERVYLEYVDDARFGSTMKWIRGTGAHVRCVNCIDVVIAGGKSHDCQGQYAFDFESGGPYYIDNVTIQGSAAMSAAGGAHVRIGATSDVKIGRLNHVVIGTEARVFDQAGAGRRTTLTRDMASVGYTFSRATLTAGGNVTADSLVAGITEYVMSRAGKIVSITARNSAVHTAGVATIKTTVNGIATGPQVQETANNRSSWNDVGYGGATAVAVVPGDRLGVQISADGSVTPTTATYAVTLVFVPDPILTT